MADKRIIASKELVDKVKELDGYELLREIAKEVIQEVLEAERDENVGVGRYERSDERNDTRSGYKPREIVSGVGKLSLRMPQTRNGMKSEALDSYGRVDQSVLLMAAEMYAAGVSTRRVKKLLETTIGTGVSAQTVSNAAKRLDKAIEELRTRPLGETPALIVDARFDKVRRSGAVRNSALLVIVGIEADGRRRVLDFAAVDSEKKNPWKELFLRLKKPANEADVMKPGLGEYMEETVPDGFAVFALPVDLRRQLRTTNMLERLNQEIKRRTKLVRSFPGMESYERLAGTVLVRTDEEWQAAGRKYIDVELLKEALEGQTKKNKKLAA